MKPPIPKFVAHAATPSAISLKGVLIGVIIVLIIAFIIYNSQNDTKAS